MDPDERKRQAEDRRKKLEEIKKRGKNIPASTINEQPTRGRNLMRSQAVSLSIEPRPRTPTERYQVEIQCELASRSLEVKTTKDQEEEEINIDLLQPREKKKKEEKPLELAIQPIKTLSLQEVTSLVKSKHFNDFINQTSKMCEKILDYGDGEMMELMLGDDMKANQHGTKEILTPAVKFYDQHYTHNRVVTALDWSHQIPELLLASYSQNEEGNIKDHVGVLLLWSLNLRSRPQFHCFCQSMITSAKFFPYAPSTILGGCYNGQLLQWDLRAKSLPVNRTGLSSQGHKYPVYTLNVVGTQIANTVVSISNDGKLCIWDIRSFGNPIRQTKQQRTDINVTCSEFPEGDVNTYYYGTENSAIYRSSLHTAQSQNADQKPVSFDGHNGPITGLSVNNPSSEYSVLSGLVLSSSFDWSVKLWNPRLPTNQLVRTFEHSDDYIYDVDWHPQNPALFSTSNNEGFLDLWDLTSDLQIPAIHLKVGKNALNKCMWNLDGTKIMTGDSQGNVNVFDLDKKLQRIDPSKTDDLEALLYESQQI